MDFSYVEFKNRLFCKDTKFNQLAFVKESVFQNGMYIENCQFHNNVFSLTDDSEGTLLIENFNLNKFENTSKLNLFELEKTGRVEIGSGCRKYRHQTTPKRINIQKGNQSLVTELTNTFVSFFKIKMESIWVSK